MTDKLLLEPEEDIYNLDKVYLDNLRYDEDPTQFEQSTLSKLNEAFVNANDPFNTDVMGRPIMSSNSKMDSLLRDTWAKGMLMEGGGFVGDILGLGKGIFNILEDPIDQIMTKIKDPTVKLKPTSAGESFARGFPDIADLNLPPVFGMTSEKVGEKLTEMGFDPISKAETEEQKNILENVQLAAQIINPLPGAELKALGKGYKAVKNLNSKSVKILDNGVTEYKSLKDYPNVYTKDGFITNKEGTPIDVYHGTGNPDLKINNLNIEQQNRGLMYFTNSQEKASNFAVNNNNRYSKTNTRVIKAKIAMEKPFIVNNFHFSSGVSEELKIIASKIYGLFPKKYGKNYKSNIWSVNPQTIKILKEKGYDGIIVSEKGSGDKEFYMPFYDASVKNAKTIKEK